MTLPARHLFILAGTVAVATMSMPAPSACAQANPASRGNQACFNQKEAEAEAEVRTGIHLREILRRCAAVYPEGQAALEDWYRFDQENADRLQAAVVTRRQALDHIHKSNPNRVQWENDAIVASMKSIQVNESVCEATYDVVERLKTEKWEGFRYYAKLHANLLAREIPRCRS